MTFSNQPFRSALTLIVMSMLLGTPHPAAAEVPIRDGFVGVVTKSKGNKPGSQIIFANLLSTRPFVTWPSGNGVETNKVFENDELVVLFFVSDGTGSTETFYLNKKTQRFTLVEVGALEAIVMKTELKPVITFGTLK